MSEVPLDPALPRQSQWLFNWFRRYCARYARRHFHAVRLSRTSHEVPAAEGKPLIFVMNHPSWWDIIIGFVLLERFTNYRHYAPIDAEMLPKYRFFNRLGFFGIDSTPRGAARFLRTSRAIFEQPYRAMWITAQGKFVDPRQRPIELRPGVGYVASRLKEGFVIPVAVEYPFWEERTPEALVRFGEPLDLAANGTQHVADHADRAECTRRIEAALTAAQDALSAEAVRRDPTAFDELIAGKAGIGGVYDWWRRLRHWLRGRRFDPSHSPPPATAKVEERSA
jgi:1-acyl-sn-glycerol-3-phosphate acyltransferase